MPQPVPKRKTAKVKVTRLSKEVKKKKPHPKYGTSKLEDYFAENFLNVLGVKYIRQYEAKEIGRFYDFKIENGPILEINGSYWHGDKRIYEEKDLNSVQKKNIYIDNLKRRWAENNGIEIYYFWEKDIHENPEQILLTLKEILKNIKRKTRKINVIKCVFFYY